MNWTPFAQNPWMPCKLALPPRDGEYLVQYDFGTVAVMPYCRGKWNAFLDADGNLDVENVVNRITAWAYTPEPWRDEDGKDE